MRELRHHPSDDVLAAYVSGALADGPSLVTAIHLEHCARCRADLGLHRQVAGALMADLPPAEMHPDALDLALARIERAEPSAPAARARRRASPGGVRLPAALADRTFGFRRFGGPGHWVAQVKCPRPDGWRTYLVSSPAGAPFARHGHRGPEYLVVLRGGYVDEGALYGPGDFATCGVDDEHAPENMEHEPCVCLVSGFGGLRVGGLLGLLQPWLGV